LILSGLEITMREADRLLERPLGRFQGTDGRGARRGREERELKRGDAALLTGRQEDRGALSGAVLGDGIPGEKSGWLAGARIGPEDVSV
jgi:hypothetical protein